MTRLPLTVVPLTLLLILAGCGAKGAGSGASATDAGVPGSKYDAGPRAGDTPFDHERAEAGAKLFATKGCIACHAQGRRLTGPDLAGVSQRRTAAWIENQVLHPDVMTKEDPISHGLLAKYALQMPNQGLTPDEARSVIEFFKRYDQGSAANAAAGSSK
jgi:mono/diheme cytochrome c family protein